MPVKSTYALWIKDTFEVAPLPYGPQHESPWYDWYENPLIEAIYMRHFFNTPRASTQHYTDAQINAGLWEMIGASGMTPLFDTTVIDPHRLGIVRAMFKMFQQVFAPRCTPHLGHLMRSMDDQTAANPLNSICYMWWDILPLYGKSGNPHVEVLDSTCLDVMERTLTLESIACQESALHGLGHWRHAYPQQVDAIIDDFLNRETLPDALQQYALNALGGCVL